MLIRVDATSGVSIFDQIAVAIRSEIARGSLAPGDRLPAARDLATALDVNVHTVLRAYQLVRDEGLVDLRRGRGAIVTEHARPPAEISGAVRSLVADARRLGVSAPTITALIQQEFSS